MKIKDVEDRIGITRKNIRFYEEQGLLHPDRNRANGYRDYSEEDVRRLEQIKLLRALSVPIDEIRRLFAGSLTLSDCLSRHQIHLTRQKRMLDLASEICSEISLDTGEISQLDAGRWMDEMAQRSQGSGQRRDWFAEAKKLDVTRKKRGAVLAALFMVLIPVFWISFPLLILHQTGESMPIGMIVVLSVVSILFLFGLATVLKERLKEIEEGEEDEALKY